jgi:predicted nucleic acid-binding protein
MTALPYCVVDASVCIKLFINDPLTPRVNQLFDYLNDPSTQFFVPDLFYIECANVLCKYVRANLYTAEQAKADLLDLRLLRLQSTSTQNLMAEATEIGLKYSISAYDACYVALSQNMNAPLLTLDRRLVNALAESPFNVCLFTDFQLPDVLPP